MVGRFKLAGARLARAYRVVRALARGHLRPLGALALAAAVGLALWVVASKAGGEFRSASFEGEAMNAPALPPGGPSSRKAYTISRDKYASGDKALRLRAGLVTFTMAVHLTVTSERLVVRARGTQCNGSPKLAVSVDDRALTAVPVGPTWSDYSFPVSMDLGSHLVAISMQDDLFAPGCDRDLLVDDVTIYG